MSKKGLLIGVSLSLLVGLSACATSTSVHYYALQDGRALAVAPSQAQDSVGVASVNLPKLLNRPQLVFRASSAELVFAEQEQWAGRLQEEIQQLLMDEWQKLAPSQLFYAYPSVAQVSTKEVRSVEIIQLDGQLGGEVQLQAVCQARDERSRHLLWQRNVSLKTQMTSQLVSDYVLNLGGLIRQLATQCQ